MKILYFFQSATRKQSRGVPLWKPFDWFDLGIVIFLSVSFIIVSQLPIAPKKFGDDVFFSEAKSIAHFFHGSTDLSEITISRAPGPVCFYAVLGLKLMKMR